MGVAGKLSDPSARLTRSPPSPPGHSCSDRVLGRRGPEFGPASRAGRRWRPRSLRRSSRGGEQRLVLVDGQDLAVAEAAPPSERVKLNATTAISPRKGSITRAPVSQDRVSATLPHPLEFDLVEDRLVVGPFRVSSAAERHQEEGEPRRTLRASGYDLLREADLKRPPENQGKRLPVRPPQRKHQAPRVILRPISWSSTVSPVSRSLNPLTKMPHEIRDRRPIAVIRCPHPT